MTGLSTRTSISFGCALVAGRNRVPRPAAGKTALRIARRIQSSYPSYNDRLNGRSGLSARGSRGAADGAAEARRQPDGGARRAGGARVTTPADAARDRGAQARAERGG